MKQLILLIVAFMCLACSKDSFDFQNPDPARFVEQLKKGTYNYYELGEKGEKLWPKMPSFQQNDIPLLVQVAKDTSMICPCDHFPVNPASSVPPYRVKYGKACMMMGEYLLWCVEAVIAQRKFASLIPYLEDTSHPEPTRLTGKQIWIVREMYLKWRDGDQSPLISTNYRWR